MLLLLIGYPAAAYNSVHLGVIITAPHALPCNSSVKCIDYLSQSVTTSAGTSLRYVVNPARRASDCPMRIPCSAKGMSRLRLYNRSQSQQSRTKKIPRELILRSVMNPAREHLLSPTPPRGRHAYDTQLPIYCRLPRRCCLANTGFANKQTLHGRLESLGLPRE